MNHDDADATEDLQVNFFGNVDEAIDQMLVWLPLVSEKQAEAASSIIFQRARFGRLSVKQSDLLLSIANHGTRRWLERFFDICEARGLRIVSSAPEVTTARTDVSSTE